MSYDQVDLALKAATKTSRYVGADAAVGLVVRYKGTAATANLAVSAAGDLVFYRTNAAGTLTVDADITGGGSGVIDVSVAAYNTFGEVVDRINASSYWEAILVDALRSDSSNNTLTAVTRTNAGVQTKAGKSLLIDLSDADVLCCNLTHRTDLSKPGLTDTKACLKKMIVMINGTASEQVAVYARKGVVETQMLRAVLTGGTEATIDLGVSTDMGGIECEKGGEIIVRLSGDDVSAGYATAIGYVNYREPGQYSGKATTN